MRSLSAIACRSKIIRLAQVFCIAGLMASCVTATLYETISAETGDFVERPRARPGGQAAAGLTVDRPIEGTTEIPGSRYKVAISKHDLGNAWICAAYLVDKTTNLAEAKFKACEASTAANDDFLVMGVWRGVAEGTDFKDNVLAVYDLHKQALLWSKIPFLRSEKWAKDKKAAASFQFFISPDGSRIVALNRLEMYQGGGYALKIFETATGREVAALTAESLGGKPEVYPLHPVESQHFSADGARVSMRLAEFMKDFSLADINVRNIDSDNVIEIDMQKGTYRRYNLPLPDGTYGETLTYVAYSRKGDAILAYDSPNNACYRIDRTSGRYQRMMGEGRNLLWSECSEQ